MGIAVDGAGNVWIADRDSDTLTELPVNAVSCAVPCSDFSGGGLSGPSAVTTDAFGNVWVANGLGSSVTELVGVAKGSPNP